jgi:hypothetical protein
MALSPDRRNLEQEAGQVKSRLYLCEVLCGFTGPIRDLIEATGLSDARAQFFIKHRVQPTHIKPAEL